MKLLFLDDEGIAGFLTELEDEGKALRKNIAELVMFLTGRISWTEAWLMSKEDRQNLADAFAVFQKKMK